MSSPVEGFVAKGFEPVRAAFEQNFAEGLEIGAGFAAMIDGEPIVNLWGGHTDKTRTKPWTKDTIVPVHSTTKPIAALIVAMQVQARRLAYDLPVAHYWPEFGDDGKDQVTVAQALSHQAGVPGFVERIDPDLWMDPPALMAALATQKPLWTPGTACGYHAMTYGYIAAALVERVSGRTIGTILREDICEPLGIDFHVGLPDDQHGRCAIEQLPSSLPEFGEINEPRRVAFFVPWATPRRIDDRWRRAEMPSTNGHGNALSVAQLFGAYANEGKIGDLRLVDPQVFEELIVERINGDDLVMPYRMSWAAGVMRNNNKIYGPNPRTLAHAGRGGSFGLGDPDKGLSAGYVMNKLAPALQTDERAQRLITALYDCL